MTMSTSPVEGDTQTGSTRPSSMTMSICPVEGDTQMPYKALFYQYQSSRRTVKQALQGPLLSVPVR